MAVNLGPGTALLVKQAIELSAMHPVTIHLLHVYQPGRDAISNNGTASGMDFTTTTLTKLEQWKACLQEAVPQSTVKGYLLPGILQQRIIEVAKNIKPQLIIIGKPPKAGLFGFCKGLTADELSTVSKCPVLTVTGEDRHNKIKTVIVPVRHFVPLRKMELLVIFAKAYRLKVLLVAMQDRVFNKEKERQVLLETYKILRNGLNNKVEYLLLNGSNFSKAIVSYAEQTGADLLMVNPKKETRVSAIFRTGINDILPHNSRLKILSVVPYHDL